MVVKNARRASGCLAVAMLFHFGSIAAPARAQVEAIYSSTKARPEWQEQSLKTILNRIEQKYQVQINYVGSTIKGILATMPAEKNESITFVDYLNRFLEPLGLQAEELNTKAFVIYRSAAKPAPAKKDSATNTQPVATAVAAEYPTTTIPQQVQTKTIEGQVIDETGLALIGVTVVEKGTRNGTQTDANGRYKLLNVHSNATLIFSYIGYKTQEVHSGKRTTIDVKLLTNVQSMKDVVITGYQKIDKNNFTGQSITISGDELKKINPQNILASIQAYDPSFRIVENNIAGSNPNKLPNINVRGTTALPTSTGDVSDLRMTRSEMNNITNLPLIILDGYQVNLQTIYDLDPNRIETVTLLKDAAATAVYGSRAANGVLVFVTKAPKEGKLELYYNFELNVTSPDLTAYSVLDAKDKLEYERLAGLYSQSDAENIDALEQKYYAKLDNVLRGYNTYWLSQPVGTEFGQRHSLSLQGGSQTVKYGIDARYQNNNGVMLGSGRERYSLATNLAYNLKNNKLLFRNQFTISQVNGKDSPYGSFDTYVKMNPYYPIRDENGRLLREIDGWKYRDYSNSGGAITTDYVLNPLYDAQTGSFSKSQYLEFIDAFSMEYVISSAFRARGEISLTKRQNNNDRFISPLSNQYYDWSGDDLKDRGEYYYTAEKETQVDGNATLSYNKMLAGGHFINATYGINFQSRDYDRKDLAAQGFTNDRFTDINFARIYKKDASPGGEQRQERLFGTFVTVNYSYQNRFLMDATFRLDGSSKFGVDARMAPFWSYGLGWNLHNEKFLQGTAVSNLKIRATTGLTGDVSFPAYLSNTTYQYYTGDWYSTGVGAVFKAYGNPELRWQRTQNYDIGADIGLFKDRIYFTPRYYYKHTRDLLADVNVPPSNGFSSYKTNLGEMVNKGYEVMLRANPIRSRNWSLTLSANMVRNTNIITKISDALKNYNDAVDKEQQDNPDLRSVPLLRFQEGQSLRTIYAVRSLGIDPENGKEIFLTKEGKRTYEYDVRDIVPVGDETPDIYGYLGASLVYKNFMIDVRMFTSLGGDLYNQTLVDRVENADPRYNVDSRVLAERWKKPGDKAIYKDISDLGTTRVTSRFVQEENKLELSSVFLSYDAPAKFYKRLKMQNLRFSLNMNDIGYWSSIKAERGIEYPFARSFTFSLSTRF
ncbi:SusC/RagA family TonB-linked outer membrane protein [Chitinophaga caeni]|uniref:SusC/RagA family TonB-linked outer membrane protein n=1 Tax=Chitinophaga caeni TaxID=2029983 RepID=A0A291QPG2_9BACT|nr:SusC/RagA family TonB-linked outer membrane protein [Chitinophaga caeni]ATL45888.1 SusC/RagA family TonB-linked outer membrane protein [Chitinophaga caeni]